MNINLVLAELALVVHLLFILWVIGGALIVRRYPGLQWVHIGSLAYGIVIEIVPWAPCPLTLLEQMLQRRAGVATYRGPFLLHYLDAFVYPNVSITLLISVAVALCAANLAYYAYRWRTSRKVRRQINS